MKTSRTMCYRAVALALFGGLFNVAMADDSELQLITVTADYNTGVADTVTVTNKAVEGAATDELRDLFRDVPGVELETTTIEGLAGFRVRGMGGSGSNLGTGQNRVAVNVDGVPLPDTFKRGHATRAGLAPIDTDDLKAVEIIRGPETSISGKSGLAGTLKFVTKDPEDYYDKSAGERFGGNVRTGYSSADKALSLGASVAGQFTDELSAMVSYSHGKSDEMPNYDGEKPYFDNGTPLTFLGELFDAEKMADRIDSADIASDNVMAKVVFEPNDNHRFSAKAEHSQRDVDIKAVIPDSANFADAMNACQNGNRMACMVMGFAFRPQKPYNDSNDSERKALTLRHDFVLDSAVADDGYWQTYYQSYDNHRDNELAYGDQYGKVATADYDVDGYGIEANLTKTIEAGSVEHTLSYGVNLQNHTSKSRQHSYRMNSNRQIDENNTTYQPDTQTRQITTYVNDDIALADGKFHIMPGVEFTHYSIHAKETPNYPADLELIDLTDNHFSWRLGTTYDINDSHQAFAGYRQGYKVPSFNELNSSSGHGRVNNPNLKPEQSSGFTVGLRSQGDIGSQTVSAFHDTYRDLAVPGRLPNGDETTVNMEDKVVIYGVEYRGELDLSAAMEGLKLRGSLAYAKGKNKETDQPYSDVEPFNGSVGLAYDAPSQQWGMAVTTNFAKAKKADDIAAADNLLIPVGGYGVTDLTAYFKPAKGLQINAGVYNVFDKKYAKWSAAQYNNFFKQNYNQITEPGRFFGAKIKYDF